VSEKEQQHKENKMFKSIILSLSILSISSVAFACDSEGLPDGHDSPYASAYIMERKDGGTLMGEHRLVVFNPVQKSESYMEVKVYSSLQDKYETYSLDPRRVYLEKTDNLVR
jgi:hypothetical protein